MLAENLNRIVAQLSKNFLRVLREASHKELIALLPNLRKIADSRPQRAAKKASAKAEKPAKAKKGKPAKAPEKPAKRGAGSLTRQILNLLKIRREGFRSEEIQRRLKADPEDLRETLANLLKGGRIERHGQARGTRYCLPSGDGEAPASVDGAPAPASPRPAPPEAPPIKVTENMIDQVRLILLNSASPVPQKELQAKLSFQPAHPKAILEHMVSEGLIEKIRSGPINKYELNPHAPNKKGDAPRVIKRAHGEEGDHADDKAPEADKADPAGT